jgi:hypothetical protein
MHTESDANLSRFLGIYNSARVYLLLPAIWKGTDPPEFLPDLAIGKRNLSVKDASEIGEHDVEAMALGKGS